MVRIAMRPPPKSFDWKNMLDTIWVRVALLVILSGSGLLSIREAIEAAIG